MNPFRWHTYLVGAFAGRRYVALWRRGIRRDPLVAWEFAPDPARADEEIRRNRSRERGVARYRDIVCQGCSSLPCIC